MAIHDGDLPYFFFSGLTGPQCALTTLYPAHTPSRELTRKIHKLRLTYGLFSGEFKDSPEWQLDHSIFRESSVCRVLMFVYGLFRSGWIPPG